MFAFNWQTGLESLRRAGNHPLLTWTPILSKRNPRPDCDMHDLDKYCAFASTLSLELRLQLHLELQLPGTNGHICYFEIFCWFCRSREEFAARFHIWGFHLAKSGHYCTTHFSFPFFLRRSEWHTNCPACCAPQMHSPFAIGLTWRMSDLILNYGFWFISHSQSVMDLCLRIPSLAVSSIPLISDCQKNRAEKEC